MYIFWNHFSIPFVGDNQGALPERRNHNIPPPPPARLTRTTKGGVEVAHPPPCEGNNRPPEVSFL